MTTKQFDIAFDNRRSLLKITIHGLWDLDQVALYAAHVNATIDALLRSPATQRFYVLVDVRDHPVQPRDVTEALQQVIAGLERGVIRLALITSASALQTMQAKRVAQRTDIGVFASDDAASEWLLS